jgi:hypothetical protein
MTWLGEWVSPAGEGSLAGWPSSVPAVLVLPLGLLLVVLALKQRSLAIFVSGAFVAGLGQGVFMGSLATINRLAAAEKRAETISSYFVVSYVAISVPVIGVGFAARVVRSRRRRARVRDRHRRRDLADLGGNR